VRTKKTKQVPGVNRMKQIEFRWPEGKTGALTTSWDDGTIHDRRLVEILNRHGLKGAFNLNSGRLGRKVRSWHEIIAAAEVQALYAGHEVACHGVTHPSLQELADDQIRAELLEDRRSLERLVGYPVRGLALPNGSWDRRVLRIAKECGLVYSRPTTRHDNFFLPLDFMDWHTTAHHKTDLTSLWKKFSACRRPAKLFYLWGHSYEFDNDQNWPLIEDFAALAGPSEKVWHATNMQICEYVTAWRNLQFTADLDRTRNISHLKLWYAYENDVFSIRPNETVAVPIDGNYEQAAPSSDAPERRPPRP
jgi:hypothetical protein